MASTITTPLQTGEGRIFINIDGFGVNTKFDFHNCMKMDGLDKSFGDVEPIYCPDPKNYDSFVEIGTIRGADGRWSSTLSGKLPANTYSSLEILADQRCAFNLQVHYGRCSRPDDFNNFESAIVLEDVRITGYNLSTLTALAPGERATVDESAGISARNMYRVFNPTVTNIAKTEINAKQVTAIANVDTKSCGVVCSGRSDGNQAWIAIRHQNVTNTPADLMYTTNGGRTWTNKPTSQGYDSREDEYIVAAGDYVYYNLYTEDDEVDIFRAELPALMNDNVLNQTSLIRLEGAVITGMSSSENYVWFTTEAALYRINKNSGEIVVMFNNPYFIGFYSLHALSDTSIIIGTEDTAYFYSTDGIFFTPGSVEPLLDNASPLEAVHMFNEIHWIVTGEDGVYGTNDAGKTWRTLFEVSNPAGMSWYDNITGYIVTTAGIFRSIDTGNTWKKVATYSISKSIDIVVSPYNPNIFMALSNETGVLGQIHKGSV